MSTSRDAVASADQTGRLGKSDFVASEEKSQNSSQILICENAPKI